MTILPSVIQTECEAIDGLIKRYISQSKKYVKYVCFQYGLLNYVMYGIEDSRFSEDFEYFAFTKSTKTLVSIRMLLKEAKNEDALILLRSIFESYLACRFFSENPELTRDFIFTPMLIANKVYYYDTNEEVYKNREGEDVDYVQRQPTMLKLGKDKGYFHDFYDHLCNYAHCNYSTLSCYLDKNNRFSCCENINPLLIRCFILFVYTKLFEQIVTVEGEEFPDEKTKKACYSLVKDATIFLNKILGTTIISSSVNVYLKRHMTKMLVAMKKSLKEELGNLKKDFI